jgi:hypothetical protein
MTLSRADMEAAIFPAAVMAGTNANVIFYYPNAPRPELPYTSYRYFSMSPSQSIARRFNKETELVEYFECRQVTYQIDCFSTDPTQAQSEAANIVVGWAKNLVRWELSENEPISVWRTTGPQDTTTLIDGAFESRATFEVVFNILVEDGSTTEDLGYFDTVGEIPWTNIP